MIVAARRAGPRTQRGNITQEIEKRDLNRLSKGLLMDEGESRVIPQDLCTQSDPLKSLDILGA